jgi:hypothetical protein
LLTSAADPDPGSGAFDRWIRDPGWKRNPDPGSGMNIPDLIFDNLISGFWVKST